MDGERFPARGDERPDPAALLRPSGGNPEAFMAKHLDADGERRLDELYVDFGATDPTGDITISYGEWPSGTAAMR